MSVTAPERAPLARIATKSLASARQALEDTTTWLAVSDVDGRVVYQWSSTARLRRQLERADVSTGTQLALKSAGANGIGMALERKALAIIRGADHDDERWQSLTCAAIPLLHPLNRQMLGAVNVTCLDTEANPYLKLTLKHVTEAIQSTLMRASQARHGRLLEKHLRVKSGTRAVVLTLDRYTMIVDDGAGQGTIDRTKIWALVEAAGIGAAELVLPTGEHAQILPIDPADPARGCSLVMNRFDPGAFVQLGRRAERACDPTASNSPLQMAEREVIAEMLRECSGNKSEVAQKLQLSRGTLYERIRRYGL
ncbi:helix-turn-helix domain-containing protein [Paeniglutamicibacter terrestris]|uniref:DNA binding HTH domain-containing protein n=1 Tax=Paeniglutamicibacter terrestris TaxID=2723403 RepID=A0ABX1G1A0_9MICC|nr:helix-turn-helix domain-containing protein [Paeniglutamicibacter terrestris]NKG19819.1 hypothetical protein [Paeniglutamicibacter terrestris]